MNGFLIRAAMAALGLWLATQLLTGMSFADPGTLLAAALLLGIVNAIIRPLVLILTLPITVLTLGLFLLAINAGMLALVALMLEGFHITNFWTAVKASLIVSVTSWLASALIGNKGRVEMYRSRRRKE